MKLVLFGIGTLADLALHYFEHDSPHEVVGFTVDKPYVDGPAYGGLPLVPFEEVERHFPPDRHGMFVALGYAGVNRAREDKCRDARERGYELVTYVSPRAVSLGESPGTNCFIFETAVIQPFASIGDGVIIWPGTVVSHHSTIEDFCYLSPNATISGECHLGRRVFVGAGAVLRDRTTVAANIVVGAGSVVTANLSDEGIYRGNPAKFFKPIDPDSRI